MPAPSKKLPQRLRAKTMAAMIIAKMSQTHFSCDVDFR